MHTRVVYPLRCPIATNREYDNRSDAGERSTLSLEPAMLSATRRRGKPRNVGTGQATKFDRKTPVFVLVQRDGKVRAWPMARATAACLQEEEPGEEACFRLARRPDGAELHALAFEHVLVHDGNRDGPAVHINGARGPSGVHSRMAHGLPVLQHPELDVLPVDFDDIDLESCGPFELAQERRL